MSNKDLTEQQPMSIDEIVKNADEVRRRILEVSEINYSDIAPNMFDYASARNDLGINIISNVDIGNASAQVGDHVAKKVPYLAELEEHVKLMENASNAVVILNGNLFTFVPKSNQTGLYSYETQAGYFISLFSELAAQGKILAITRGKEDHRIDSLHKIDLVNYLATGLGLENKVCNQALINIDFKSEEFGDVNVMLKSLNWQNVAHTASYIKKTLHKRASQYGLAGDKSKSNSPDIFYASTVKNVFSVETGSEIKDGKTVEKPIYLISAGPYKPFMGAKSAGAEENSVRDAANVPNMFWYKVDAVPSRCEKGEYELDVRPKHYLAHQEKKRENDEATSKIISQQANVIDIIGNVIINEIFERQDKKSRENAEVIREVLRKNDETEKRNNEIRKYVKMKRGIIDEVEEDKLHDAGSNIEKQGVVLKSGNLADVMFIEKDNTRRARYVNAVVSPEIASKGIEISDGAFPEETTRTTGKAKVDVSKIKSSDNEMER